MSLFFPVHPHEIAGGKTYRRRADHGPHHGHELGGQTCCRCACCRCACCHEASSDFKLGDVVSHPHYGEGEVTAPGVRAEWVPKDHVAVRWFADKLVWWYSPAVLTFVRRPGATCGCCRGR